MSRFERRMWRAAWMRTLRELHWATFCAFGAPRAPHHMRVVRNAEGETVEARLVVPAPWRYAGRE